MSINLIITLHRKFHLHALSTCRTFPGRVDSCVRQILDKFHIVHGLVHDGSRGRKRQVCPGQQSRSIICSPEVQAGLHVQRDMARQDTVGNGSLVWTQGTLFCRWGIHTLPWTMDSSSLGARHRLDRSHPIPSSRGVIQQWCGPLANHTLLLHTSNRKYGLSIRAVSNDLGKHWRSFARCRTYQMQLDEHLCDI